MSDSPALPQIVTLSALPSLDVPSPSGADHRDLPASRDQSPVTAHESQVTTLLSYFNALLAAHGPQRWWPGRTRFEIILGAILTQNTSWKNVEQAIANLRRARLLTPAAIHGAPSAAVARQLRPSGYFRQKTKTVKGFVNFLFAEYGGSLTSLFATPTAILRERLLTLRGIGPETADSILLYAGNHPVFVVDAYSRRVLERHAVIPSEPNTTTRRLSRNSYEQLRSLFESQLPRDPLLFNEFHALIVYTGKRFCRKRDPTCSQCPLQSFLPLVAGRRSLVAAP
jgi:endonuclease-3 related protein